MLSTDPYASPYADPFENRCDNCELVIEERINEYDGLKLCAECYTEVPLCDYCKEPGKLEHVVYDFNDPETGPQHDEADMCQACILKMVRRRT